MAFQEKWLLFRVLLLDFFDNSPIFLRQNTKNCNILFLSFSNLYWSDNLWIYSKPASKYYREANVNIFDGRVFNTFFRHAQSLFLKRYPKINWIVYLCIWNIYFLNYICSWDISILSVNWFTGNNKFTTNLLDAIFVARVQVLIFLGILCCLSFLFQQILVRQ